MPPVFAHGRLRLYLLKLLDESPRHGYEVIRLLEERFQGLYAPSAGTVYPRLAKLEKEGLVTHTTEGGRKVYALTDAGREELAARSEELVDLEQEIRASVSELAAEIREDVRGVAGDLRREIREAARAARTDPDGGGHGGRWKQDWKDQARQAKEESRRAKEEARTARQQAEDAQEYAREEVRRIARLVQEGVQDQVGRGDWQGAVRDGLAEFSREMGRLGRTGPWTRADAPRESAPPRTAQGGAGAGPLPQWAQEEAAGGDPARSLERLLDRFRDEVRDAARDHGVDEGQLREVRQHLAAAAAHVTDVLRRTR